MQSVIVTLKMSYKSAMRMEDLNLYIHMVLL